MNLNSIVSGVISAVTPPEEVHIFRCTGQVNVKGVVTAEYALGVKSMVQVRSVSDEVLALINRVGENTKHLHFYLNGDWRGIFRPDGTGGDFIYARNEWWLITAVPEDFSRSGWVCVRGTMQMTGPDGVVPP